nr:formylglycine-generating enzyme family protein [uncultured Roseobacter sp.]
MVPLKGGFFMMGARKSQYAADLDSPQRKVKISGFQLSRTTITNAVFQAFAQETSYETTAEREGWSYVFEGFLNPREDYSDHAAGTPWWRRVDGACWSHPEGPESNIVNRMDHPATHISWDDAMAFCQYSGTRLPTEAEWEYAARGGLRGARHPWGNTLVPSSGHAQNVWQGDFPATDLALDGYCGTAPAEAYQPNEFGLFNMTGNVWEWCADWFGALPDGPKTRPPHDPKGLPTGPGRVIRGGSYLCHASYCERYFVHSRTWNTPDSTTGHTGFRVAC